MFGSGGGLAFGRLHVVLHSETKFFPSASDIGMQISYITSDDRLKRTMDKAAVSLTQTIMDMTDCNKRSSFFHVPVDGHR